MTIRLFASLPFDVAPPPVTGRGPWVWILLALLAFGVFALVMALSLIHI